MRPSDTTGERNEPRDQPFGASSARGSFCVSGTQRASPLCHTVPTRPAPGAMASWRESFTKRSTSAVPTDQASCMRMTPASLSSPK